MPRYRVAICHEESVVIELSADDEHQAEELAYDLADEYGTSIPPQFRPETVHREFFTQDAMEIEDKAHDLRIDWQCDRGICEYSDRKNGQCQCYLEEICSD